MLKPSVLTCPIIAALAVEKEEHPLESGAGIWRWNLALESGV